MSTDKLKEFSKKNKVVDNSTYNNAAISKKQQPIGLKQFQNLECSSTWGLNTQDGYNAYVTSQSM